jgi:hypothetical protein
MIKATKYLKLGELGVPLINKNFAINSIKHTKQQYN